MKRLLLFAFTTSVLVCLLSSCGPSEEELRQQEMAEQQARVDSLNQVREAQIEQMRLDSLARARTDSITASQPPEIEYDPEGNFTVQVQSWRSEEKAMQRADLWEIQGFDHVYIVEHGDESVGDVWYRVRLGNLPTIEMAERLSEQISSEYGVETWVVPIR